MDIQGIKKLEDRAKWILEKYPHTRDCDISLTNGIWLHWFPDKIKNIDGENYVNILDLKRMAREDNVKRVRAKIQNEMLLFLPTRWEIAKRRKIEQSVWEYYAVENYNYII